MLDEIVTKNAAKIIDGLDLEKPIVLLGCDGAGKTTIANALNKELGWKIVKPASIANGPFNAEKLDEEVYAKHTILDRSCTIDDYVYNGITSEYKYNDEDVKYFFNVSLDSILDNYNVVYVFASPEDIRSRLAVRGDNYIDVVEPNIENILRKYHHLIRMMIYNTPAIITVNTTKSEVIKWR